MNTALPAQKLRTAPHKGEFRPGGGRWAPVTMTGECELPNGKVTTTEKKEADKIEEKSLLH